LGLLRVEGRISIDGVDVAKAPQIALQSVAYIPQVAPPIDASVAEVVRAHCGLRNTGSADVARAAARLGLRLETVAALRFRDLSGGMRQKLLAALALATRAPILVCDEPTANLDPEARAAFFEEIAALPAESIVILCSHRSEEVEGYVGRIIEFAEGRIARDRARGFEPAPTSNVVQLEPTCGQEAAS
jgi:ABC-2 type transport system ATP-binding protein